MRGVVTGSSAQANEACPLPCASGSPAGCGERFQCYKGCPLCIPPPQNGLCNGFKQVLHLAAHAYLPVLAVVLQWSSQSSMLRSHILRATSEDKAPDL